MAKRQVIMRVSALSLMGGALLILAAETGPFPSFAALTGGPADTRATGADRVIADPRATVQRVSLPGDAESFGGPDMVPPAPAGSLSPTGDRSRPAAFTPPPRLATPDTPAGIPAPRDDQTFGRFGLPCGLDVTAAAFDHATIALGIAAPCLPNAPVAIEHAGITVGGMTDAVGLLTMDLPALESPASVTVRLSDGTEAQALIEIPDLAAYERVALAWTGALGLELHAMEAGAGWHAPGHVHPGAMRGPEALASGEGHLTTLGTLAGAVHVYTRPLEGSLAEGGVTISVDAPVTADTCTRRADAALLRVAGAGPIEVTPFSLRYPGCDTVGVTLVLQNALEDLRLASR